MANYYWCTVLCLLVLFCGIFDCRNINNRRQTKVKKCNKIENFYGGDVVYFGNREVGTEVYYSCEDDYTQQPEDRDSSMCTETGHGAIWVPDPPDCLEMAVVQIPKNGFTDAVAAIIEHGQSYNIFCHIGYELYRGRFYNADNITITNYNGTLKPKIPGCKPARCDPLSLNETIVSYLNGTEITDLIPSGTKVMYSCIPGYEFRNENFDAGVIGRCKLGEFRRIPKCIPSCMVPDDNRYHYKNAEGKDVASGKLIDNGETLKVTCLIGSDDYDYYASNDSDIQLDTVTCYNGSLSKTDLECDEDKSGQCLDLENGKVTVTGGYRYHVQCNTGYTLGIDMPEVHCACNDGTLSCFNQVPVCKPGCMVPDDNRYHYKNAEGKDVASGKLIDNGETLKVTCLIGSDGYDYYASNDSDIQLDTVTCYNGSLSKTDLECDEDKSGQCLDLENGKVTITGGYRYHVQCNTGYTLGIDMPEVHCACNDGTLSCFNQVPVCKPDNCLIPLNHDMSIMSVKVNGVDMAGGSMVSHASHVVFDCHQYGDDVYEPNNRDFTCKAGKWIKDDRSDKRWKLDNNGTFPKCIRVSTTEATSAEESVTLSTQSDVTKQTTQSMHFDNSQAGTTTADENVTMSSLSPVTVGEKATQNMSTTTQEHGCMVPDNNRYHYKNAEGTDVASGTMIDNGETLKVTCLIVSVDYDYYASNDSDIQLDTVTCYNGSLSKTDLECDEDKSGQCLDLENGKVTVTGGYRYHVQCNTGYTLDIDMPEVHCACNDGTLSCFNQVPVCKPDNCLISLNHDMSIMSVKVNGVDMAGGSMVSHASHVVFDCHQQGNDVYEPKNRHFTCKAGKWIKGDRSDKLWKYNNNGTFPECIRVARNCTLPRWTNASKVSVPNTDKSLLSENIAVKDGEQLEIDCGVPVLLKMRYICKDGIWQQQGNKTFEHVKNGHISNCTVMIGHQGLRQFVELINGTFNAIKAWIHHLVSQIETD